MATPVLSPTSVVVTDATPATVKVSWQLDPGTPDVDGTLTLSLDGALPVSIPVRHQGTPAEQPPRLVTGNPQPGDVLVSCDVAVVSVLDQSTIRLS
jgi:hypothetical protein